MEWLRSPFLAACSSGCTPCTDAATCTLGDLASVTCETSPCAWPTVTNGAGIMLSGWPLWIHALHRCAREWRCLFKLQWLFSVASCTVACATRYTPSTNTVSASCLAGGPSGYAPCTATAACTLGDLASFTCDTSPRALSTVTNRAAAVYGNGVVCLNFSGV